MLTKSRLVVALGMALAVGAQFLLPLPICGGFGSLLIGFKGTETEAQIVLSRADPETSSTGGKSHDAEAKPSSGKSRKVGAKKSEFTPSPALESADWLIESLEAIERALPKSEAGNEVNHGIEEGK